MTARELREMLFHVNNQELTVKELRALLFEIEDQDDRFTALDMIRLTYNK